MRIEIERLREPALQFGGGETGEDPKRLLIKAGPFSAHGRGDVRTIRLGLVTPAHQDVELVQAWLRRMDGLLVAKEPNSKRFPNFPGLSKTFRCRFEIRPEQIRVIDERDFDAARARLDGGNRREAFETLLTLYREAVGSLLSDLRPDCILVCFPEDIAALRVANGSLSFAERAALERIREEEESEQLSLFGQSAEDKKLAAELMPQAEELLYRNFHRALKAQTMLLPNAVPIQVIRRQTYVSEEAKQSDATRAWNLSTALYYKTANIPWRPSGLTQGMCFVGVSFHHLKRRGGSLIYASLAQAFSSDLEPFALRGALIPQEQTRDKRPYLTEEQAADLVQTVVKEYKVRAGDPPTAVVVHKTTRYQPEEQAGFQAALLQNVAACHMIWVAPTGFRLLRHGMREPIRGTFCRIEGGDSYLFTTGFVPWWEEYPGPHIPSPLLIGAVGEPPSVDRLKEVLALTKMNWNSADGIGRHPITISFARRVGTIMSELPEDVAPNPLYRFYM
jgi:hypothetical protein